MILPFLYKISLQGMMVVESIKTINYSKMMKKTTMIH